MDEEEGKENWKAKILPTYHCSLHPAKKWIVAVIPGSTQIGGHTMESNKNERVLYAYIFPCVEVLCKLQSQPNCHGTSLTQFQ